MKRFFSLILLLFAISAGYGQIITGTLLDETNQPVSYANIVLLALPDSAFLRGTVSQENGTFQIDSEVNKNMLLRISSIGYNTVYKQCGVSSNLGTVILGTEAQTLNEVVVRANLPKTRLKGESLITNVQNSVLSNAGSANDVLAKIPGIQGKNGNFTVFGKGTPVFYVNGRLIRDLSELDQLHSSDIKSVEVVNNPGAQYDATVKAVVLIYTVKPMGEGIAFNVKTEHMYGENYFTLNQLDFNYRHKGLDILGSLFYSGGKDGTNIHLGSQTFVDTLWQQRSDANSLARRKNYKVRLGANYMFNDKHSVGVLYDFVKYTTKEPDYKMQSEMNADGKLYDIYRSQNMLYNEFPTHLMNAYYVGKVGQLSINFNIDMRWNHEQDKQKTVEESENYNDRVVDSYRYYNNGLFASKLVLEYPIWKGNLSVGEEYTSTYQKNKFSNEQGILDDTENKVQENNISVFSDYSMTLGKLNLAIGLRYEHNVSDYYEGGKLVREQSKVYNNLFPSASVSYQLGPVSTNLSYTLKTQRPSYKQLDGNLNYVNRYTYMSGNPLLNSTKKMDCTFVTSFKFLQFIASYQRNDNAIVYVINQMNKQPNISHTTFQNFNKIEQLSFFLAVSPTIGCWNLNYSAGIIKQRFQLQHLGQEKRLERPIPYFSLFNTFSLPKGFRITLDGGYVGKGHTLNMLMSENKYVDIGLSKTFLKDGALLLKIDCTDIFDWQHNRMTLYGERSILNEYDTWTDIRIVRLSARYSFNASKSKYKGTGAGADEKARL